MIGLHSDVSRSNQEIIINQVEMQNQKANQMSGQKSSKQNQMQQLKMQDEDDDTRSICGESEAYKKATKQRELLKNAKKAEIISHEASETDYVVTVSIDDQYKVKFHLNDFLQLRGGKGPAAILTYGNDFNLFGSKGYAAFQKAATGYKGYFRSSSNRSSSLTSDHKQQQEKQQQHQQEHQQHSQHELSALYGQTQMNEDLQMKDRSLSPNMQQIYSPSQVIAQKSSDSKSREGSSKRRKGQICEHYTTQILGKVVDDESDSKAWLKCQKEDFRHFRNYFNSLNILQRNDYTKLNADDLKSFQQASGGRGFLYSNMKHHVMTPGKYRMTTQVGTMDCIRPSFYNKNVSVLSNKLYCFLKELAFLFNALAAYPVMNSMEFMLLYATHSTGMQIGTFLKGYITQKSLLMDFNLQNLTSFFYSNDYNIWNFKMLTRWSDIDDFPKYKTIHQFLSKTLKQLESQEPNSNSALARTIIMQANLKDQVRFHVFKFCDCLGKTSWCHQNASGIYNLLQSSQETDPFDYLKPSRSNSEVLQVIVYTMEKEQPPDRIPLETSSHGKFALQLVKHFKRWTKVILDGEKEMAYSTSCDFAKYSLLQRQGGKHPLTNNPINKDRYCSDQFMKACEVFKSRLDSIQVARELVQEQLTYQQFRQLMYSLVTLSRMRRDQSQINFSREIQPTLKMISNHLHNSELIRVTLSNDDNIAVVRKYANNEAEEQKQSHIQEPVKNMHRQVKVKESQLGDQQQKLQLEKQRHKRLSDEQQKIQREQQEKIQKEQQEKQKLQNQEKKRQAEQKRQAKQQEKLRLVEEEKRLAEEQEKLKHAVLGKSKAVLEQKRLTQDKRQQVQSVSNSAQQDDSSEDVEDDDSSEDVEDDDNNEEYDDDNNVGQEDDNKRSPPDVNDDEDLDSNDDSQFREVEQEEVEQEEAQQEEVEQEEAEQEEAESEEAEQAEEEEAEEGNDDQEEDGQDDQGEEGGEGNRDGGTLDEQNTTSIDQNDNVSSQQVQKSSTKSISNQTSQQNFQDENLVKNQCVNFQKKTIHDRLKLVQQTKQNDQKRQELDQAYQALIGHSTSNIKSKSSQSSHTQNSLGKLAPSKQKKEKAPKKNKRDKGKATPMKNQSSFKSELVKNANMYAENAADENDDQEMQVNEHSNAGQKDQSKNVSENIDDTTGPATEDLK